MKSFLNMLARNLNENSIFAVGVFCSFLVLYYFYNQFWFPPDDGAYAYVADRILAGDILNLNVHDVHMGYINFLHAAALKVFGNEMASLRIPLLILGVIQAAIIYKLLVSKGSLIAFCGTVVITSLSFVQFLNPTANWYGLFLTILIIFILGRIPDTYRYKFIIIGYFLMMLFLFRQLSGVITSIGVLTYILYRNRDETAYLKGILSKLLFVVMLLGLFMYLYLKTSLSAMLLFGLWPIIILLYGFLFISVNNKKTLEILFGLLIGGVISAVPLLFYHIYHGSITSWYNDTVISALMLTDLSFIQKQSFLDYLIYSIYSIFQFSSITTVLNGFYWIFLILISFALGLMVFLNICYNNHDKLTSSALPIVAVFYGLISVHYQIPYYLYYTVGLSICGFLWITDLKNIVSRNILVSMLATVGLVALFCHAAQPTERLLVDILQGKRVNTEKVFLKGNVNLWITPEEAEVYEDIQDLVESNVKPDETIFAFPSNSEIYYITKRSNPFRFFNSSFGIRDKEQFDHVMSTLKSSPPRMVFYTPDDKYNTDNTVMISQFIRENYTLLKTVNGMEYYLLSRGVPDF